MLKFIISAADYEELPEALQKEYKKDGDGYMLDTDQDGRVKEFRNNNISLKKQIETLMDQIKTFEGIDKEKYEEALKKLQEIEDKNLIDAKKFDELFDVRTERMRKEYTGQISKLSSTVEANDKEKKLLQDRLASVLLNAELANGLDATGLKLVKNGMGYLIDRARKTWILQGDDTAGATMVPMNGNEVLYGKDGKNRLTMSEWLSQEVESSPFLFEGNSGGGASGNDSGQGGGKSWVDRSDSAAFSSNLEKIAKGEIEVR